MQQKCILKNSEKLIEVCVLKLDQDWFPLLDLLAILFNPNSRLLDNNNNNDDDADDNDNNE